MIEVSNVSKHGFWILIENAERFVSFKDFPWFKDATVGQILNVERVSARHLYWPDMDIDLAIESIDHPKRFLLISKDRPKQALKTRRTKRARA